MKNSTAIRRNIERENYNLCLRIKELEDILLRYQQNKDGIDIYENRYRNIVDNQIELVGIYLPDTTFIYANEAQCRYFNKKRGELIGKSFLSLVYEKDRKLVLEEFKSLTVANPVIVLEERVLAPDRSIRWQEWSYRGVFDSKGKLIEVYGIGKDINQRKQAEGQLKGSEEKYRSLFNSMHEGFALLEIICDDLGNPVDYRYLDVNPAFERIIGTKKEYIVGKTILELCPDIDKFWIKTYGRVGVSGKPEQFRRFYSRFNKYFELIAYSPGKNRCAVLFIDISEQKEMEKQMAYLDRLHLVGAIAAGIGHEIRNPMTIVRGFLQLLMEKPEYRREREHFDIMIEEIDRSNSIIKEFLSLAKIKEEEKKPQDLNSIIRALCPLLQADALASDKYIKLRLEDIPEIVLDEKGIRQLLLNLVRNGLEAMAAGGTLTIRTYEKNGEIIMKVTDVGTGIKPADLKRIKVPFFSTKRDGVGLGLPVCFNVAERNNAQIDIDSSAKGTTFAVRFKRN